MEQERSILPKLLGVGALLAVGAVLSNLSFPTKIRKRMLERDHYRCQGNSDEHYGRLEAAHYNHDHHSPEYRRMENGLILCTACHLQQHIEFAGRNGLCPEANDWAINALHERLEELEWKPL